MHESCTLTLWYATLVSQVDTLLYKVTSIASRVRRHRQACPGETSRGKPSTQGAPMTSASSLLRAYARWITTHRLSVILSVVVLTGVLLSRAGNLHIDFNPDVYSPQAHPYVQATHVIEQVFGGRNIT